MVATLEQLAALVRGRLFGDGSVPIQGARPVGEARPGDITFIENERYAKLLRTSPASAAIVGPHFQRSVSGPELPVIEVDDPISAFLAVRSHLDLPRKPRWTGIHPQAYVSATAKIGPGVAIHPFAYIGDGAEIGDDSTIYPGAVIGEGCKLGRAVVIRPNAVLYDGVTLGDRVEIHSGTVVGSDGFGFRQVDGRHVKVPQTGRVDVGDDVEIGANCAIDRATFDVTSIGAGSKIDNLVMIGHNNRIGRHNLLCAQVGIAGSCTTGDHVVLAGQAGIKDHTEIGDRVLVGAQAGVIKNIAAGAQVWGTPALASRDHHRLHTLITRLPELYKQIKVLSAQVSRLSVGGQAVAKTEE